MQRGKDARSAKALAFQNIDVLVVGDQARTLCGLLTPLTSRNVSTFFGIYRVTHTLTTNDTWLTINFHWLDDFLVDPLLISSALQPFHVVIATYTHNSDGSLRSAELLVNSLLSSDAKSKNDKHTRTTKEEEIAMHAGIKVGYGLLVSVHTDSEASVHKDESHSLPKKALDMMANFSSTVKYFDGTPNSCTTIYGWILDALAKHHSMIPSSKEKDQLLASLACKGARQSSDCVIS